jgi:hypothetical protein
MTAALLRWSTRAGTVAGTPGPYTPPGATRRGPHLTLRPVPVGIEASVPAGATVTVTADAYAPGSRVVVSIQSTPSAVGTAVAGGDGRLTADVTLPSDLAPGPHAMIAYGVAPDGRPMWTFAVLDVTRPVSLVRVVLWAVGLTFVGLAVLAWWLRRRRRRRSPTGDPSPEPDASTAATVGVT